MLVIMNSNNELLMISTHEEDDFFNNFLEANNLSKDQVNKYTTDDSRVFTHEFTIQDDEIVIGEEKKIELESQPQTIEDQVVKLKEQIIYIERVKTAAEIYEENKDREDITLEELKQLRINKLKDECSQAIYDGFISKEYEFGFNVNDQTNFTQQLLLVVSGKEGNIQWKTKSDGVIELTVDEFKEVALDAETHKRDQQNIYWLKEQEVIDATSSEEVKLISW